MVDIDVFFFKQKNATHLKLSESYPIRKLNSYSNSSSATTDSSLPQSKSFHSAPHHFPLKYDIKSYSLLDHKDGDFFFANGGTHSFFFIIAFTSSHEIG